MYYFVYSYKTIPCLYGRIWQNIVFIVLNGAELLLCLLVDMIHILIETGLVKCLFKCLTAALALHVLRMTYEFVYRERRENLMNNIIRQHNPLIQPHACSAATWLSSFSFCSSFPFFTLLHPTPHAKTNCAQDSAVFK
jgi:hypothetical protein